MLDLIQFAFNSENINFTRFDGRSTVVQRRLAINLFRDDPTVNVLLVSVGSGSVGYVPKPTHATVLITLTKYIV